LIGILSKKELKNIYGQNSYKYKIAQKKADKRRKKTGILMKNQVDP